MNIVPGFVRRRIEHRPSLLKIVDNIGWLFFDKFLRMGIGLIVGVWIARYLGPEQFGLLSFATALVGLFGAIAGLGLQGIVVRDLVHDHFVKVETLGTAAALQVIGGFLAYGLTIAVVFWLRSDDASAKAVVAVIGSMLLFKAAEVAIYWFESQVLSKYIVWVQNGVFLIFAMIKVMLILKGEPLIFFAWATMAEAFAVAIFMLVMLGRRGPGLRLLRFSFGRAKTMLGDSWPLLLSGITVVIYTRIDQIMLGQMIGDEAVGIYSAAVRISEVWYFVPVAIVASVFPAILEAKKRSEEQYRQRFQHLYNLMVWLAVVVALPMTFISTTVVTLLFGNDYAQAGSVLAIHIWASVFVFLGVASGRWFLVENRQMLSLQRTVLGAVVNVILNFIFIPYFGVLGAAWATVVANAIAAMFADLVCKETRTMFLMKLNALNLVRVVAGVARNI